MNKKQEMFREYEMQERALECIILSIHMPTGETERIVNPNVDEKIKYIAKNYDDDLVHTGCKDIYIEEYIFVEKSEGMTFGYALEEAKQGKKIARKGWNGKGMFVYFVPGASYEAMTEIAKTIADEKNKVAYEPYLAIKNVKGTVSTWVPSINDCLAEDWEVVE